MDLGPRSAMHLKMVLIDHGHVAFGSANFTGAGLFAPIRVDMGPRSALHLKLVLIDHGHTCSSTRPL